MSVSYNGIGQLMVTVPAGDCVKDAVCKVNTSGKAANCITGDAFCGVVHTVENNMAAVVLEGFVTVKYTGTPPTCGMVALVANGGGGVKTDANGVERLVIAVDSTARTATFKL